MKLSLGKHLALKMALLMALFSLIFLVNLRSSWNASAEDDAYHYMKNGIDDQLYQEWWRFMSQDNETQLMLLYLLNDPDNISQNRKIEVQALAMQEGGWLPSARIRAGALAWRDRRSPMLEIDGSASLRESLISTYGARQKAVPQENEDIRDLTFQPLASPWLPSPSGSLGHNAGDGSNGWSICPHLRYGAV